MQTMTVAQAGLTSPGTPKLNKQGHGEGMDSFAALLWLLQSGQAGPMSSGPLPDSLQIPTMGAPEPGAVGVDTTPGLDQAFGHAFPVSAHGEAQTLTAESEAQPFALPTDVQAAGDMLQPTAAGATAPADLPEVDGRQMSVSPVAAEMVAEGRGATPKQASENGASDGLEDITARIEATPAASTSQANEIRQRALTEGETVTLTSIPSTTRGKAADAEAVTKSDTGNMTAAPMPETGDMAIGAQPPMLPGSSEAAAASGVGGSNRSESASPPVWNQVLSQIEARSHELRPDGQTLEMQLHPAHLGSVRLRLSFIDGQLTAQIQVASAAVKESLESGLTQLRQSLQDQGFEVQGLAVDVRDSGHSGEHTRQGWQQWQDWHRPTTSSGYPQPLAGPELGAGGSPGTTRLLDFRA